MAAWEGGTSAEVQSSEDEEMELRYTLAWYKKLILCITSLLGMLFGFGVSSLTFFCAFAIATPQGLTLNSWR